MKRVIRTQTYLDDINAIEARIIAQGNPQAAADLWLHIDGQVDLLADPDLQAIIRSCTICRR